jgi:thioesterase domain-containing protein
VNAADFTTFLQERIPLVRAMELRVAICEPARVIIAAPLAPNLNLHGTAFGGSLAALGILAGWAMLHHALLGERIDAALVVRHSELDYLKPGTDELLAESRRPAAGWQSFVDGLRSGRRADLAVESVVRSAGVDVLRVRGRYVAVPPHVATGGEG